LRSACRDRESISLRSNKALLPTRLDHGTVKGVIIAGVAKPTLYMSHIS